MTTTAIPSLLPEDFLINIGNADRFLNSPGLTFTDRFGVERLTLGGAGVEITAKVAAVETAKSAAINNEIPAILAAIPDSGVIGFESLAALNADLAHPASVVAFVLNDPSADNNATYRKIGASGAGSWAKASASLDDLQSDRIDALQAAQDLTADSAGLEAQERTALIYSSENGGAAIADLAEVYEDDIPGSDRAWTNEYGEVAARITTTGVFEYAAPDAPTLQTGLRAGLCHILGIGQSWMGGTGGAPAITTVPQDGILMFVGGVRPADTLAAPNCFASLVPAVESNNTGDVRGETPMSGFARALADAITADEGATLASLGANLLISVVAPGGTSLGVFMRGGVYYLQIMEQITAGHARAQAMGETYRVLCCPVMLGKGDYDAGQPNKDGFRLSLAHLIADINAAVKTLVPGHPDIPFFLYQTGSHGHDQRQPTIDLALVELDRAEPLAIFAGTLSAYTRKSDAVHFTAAASKEAGALGGRLAKRYLFTGEKPAVMLPVESVAQGRVISLRYRPPSLPLVLDAAGANNPANHGFDLVDSAGATLTIGSITATRDRIVIVAAADLPTGWSLRYAWSGAYVGNTISGPRGSLRDSSTPPHWAGLFQISN